MEAAKVYPANYWYSLAQPPPTSNFPGTGPTGNGISPELKTQGAWIDVMKQGCQLCHQMGTRTTREVDLAGHASRVAAWDRRVRSGQRGGEPGDMSGVMNRFGRTQALSMFADWSDRIAGGEVPPAPPRPEGTERNVVLTMWDWATPKDFVGDMVSTDERNPTMNPYGKIYGVVVSNDMLAVVDPVANTATTIKVPIRDDPKTVPTFYPQKNFAPSPYWGDEIIWTNPAAPHNPMMDDKGRVWITQWVRAKNSNPSFCKEGSSQASAKNFPIETNGGRHLSVYDPKTQKFTLIDTCFATYHLHLTADQENVLWFSGPGGAAVGWFNTKTFDETGDPEAAQGWCPTVVDTSGDNQIGKYVEPDQPVKPGFDKRFDGATYGNIINHVDGTVWLTQTAPFPGRIIRLDPGGNPPLTCKAEVYEAPPAGYAPRGIDVDRNGVVWTALSGSGHLASFDRRKCKVLNGPTATGQHCPEGWTLHPVPGPQMKGVTDPGSADFLYYNWVDKFNTLGLGENVPIATGGNSDSLLALMPDGQWVVMRVPYPLGFQTRLMDGRIDDPKAGWKGRGLWSTYSMAATWLIEGGKGVRPSLIHFQLRPDPLAR